MTEVRTEVGVALPPEAVWTRLTAVGDAADWNPRIRFVDPLQRGTRVRMRVQLAGWWLTVQVVVVDLDPPRRLTWRGGLPGLFEGTHGFTLTPRADGGTHIAQREVFRGVLVPALWPLLAAELTALYRQIDAALAAP